MEFIFFVDFLVLNTERVPNAKSHILLILGSSLLATTNALINHRNVILKLSDGNITLDLNIFNLQRQPSGFDDVDHFF